MPQLLSDSGDTLVTANEIKVGRGFSMGKNVRIKVRGKFEIGDFGRFGNDVVINAQNVKIGNHFYHYTSGLQIGGGGSQFPDANLTIGDRCVFHNNHINLARPVTIGNDVGLSPDVDIITHGFWNSVLEGYPTIYEPVIIEDGAIIGQRSVILPGRYIAKNAVVGANSTVSNDLLEENSIYVGNPARFIRKVTELTYEQKVQTMTEILSRYNLLLHKVPYEKLEYDHPYIYLNDATINVETKEITGIETEVIDKFRDFLRRYGIRIYTERGFMSL